MQKKSGKPRFTLMQGIVNNININISNLSRTPAKDHAKCDSWVKSLNIFIFDILFEMS